MAEPANQSAGRSGPSVPVSCLYGLRYGRLSDPGNPRSAVVPATGRIAAARLTDVPVFPQLPSRLERVMGPGIRDNPQSDAAFFLNVWAPAGAHDLPVLVFLHGGAWVSGGGAARWYRGDRLAAEGMVVVTVNYRLGPAGHFEDGQGGDHRPAGDILAALGWVRDHIRDHGGDPARVTLAGQSAGAWYAWALAGRPDTAGLFRQAALLSPPGIAPWSLAERHALTAEAEALRDGLLTAGEPAETALLRAGAQVLAGRPFAAGAIPPMYLPVWPEASSHAATPLHVEALYVRTTLHEMSVFLPPPALSAASPGWPPDFARTVAEASHAVFGAFAEEIADSAEARGCRVVRRSFAALSGLPDLGAAHCFDLPFQFGNPADWRDAPMLDGWTDADFRRLSDRTVADLAAFVKAEVQPGFAMIGRDERPKHEGNTPWTV